MRLSFRLVEALVAAAMLAASAIIAWRTTQPAIRPAAES